MVSETTSSGSIHATEALLKLTRRDVADEGVPAAAGEPDSKDASDSSSSSDDSSATEEETPAAEAAGGSGTAGEVERDERRGAASAATSVIHPMAKVPVIQPTPGAAAQGPAEAAEGSKDEVERNTLGETEAIVETKQEPGAASAASTVIHPPATVPFI